MRATPPLLNTATRIYGALARLLPAPLRMARRAEMLELFRDLYRDSYRRTQGRGALNVLFRSCIGLVGTAAALRLRPFHRNRSLNPHRNAGDPMFTRFLADLRLAGRTLRRAPGFALVSMVTLALGIGATTAIFSLVYGVVIRGLPYDEAEDLVYIDHKAPALGFERDLGSGPGLHWHYSQHAETLEEIAYTESYDVTITGAGTEPTRIPALETTSSLFAVLRIRPVHGRLLTTSDDGPESERVVVLSHGLWQRRFGADPNAVGTDLEVSGRLYPIVGVLPPDFRFGAGQIFLNTDTNFGAGFGGFNGLSVARVKTGTSTETVRQELDALLTQIDRSFDDARIAQLLSEAEVGAIIVPLKTATIGDVERTLWILMGTVAFVLLIACANVANLFLVRAETRQKEIAVRHALGASRLQVLRTFLAESVTLSLAGGIAGVIIAIIGVELLLAEIPFTLPRAQEIGINGVVLAFAACISMGAGIVFAGFPALRGSGNTNEVLRNNSRTNTAGKTRVRVRQTLVIGQIALSLMLLAGAGLMARSFSKLAAVDPGFAAENLLTFQLSLPRSAYDGDIEAAGFHDRLLERIRALPGALEAGAVRDLPLSNRSGGDMLFKENDPPSDGEIPPIIWVNRAAPGYFHTLRIPLLGGRTITAADQDDARPVIVINQAAVDVFFPGEDPVGQRVAIGLNDEPGDERQWLEVIGVVGTTKQASLMETPEPVAFVTMVQESFNTSRQMTYAVRVDGDPLALADAIRTVVHEADPNLPIIRMRSMQQIVDEAAAPMAFTMVLLGIAAGLAVLLGSIGVYGVISYVVGHRTGEIGVRMALGAGAIEVRRMLLGEGAVVAAIGLAIGLAGTLAMAQSMESMLYEVAPLDPLTHGATTVVLLAVVLLATWIPARRASRIEPAVALRSD